MHGDTKKRSGGYIGISVLVLFAVAIIASQAHDNQHGPYSMDASLPTALELGVLVEQAAPTGLEGRHEAIRKFRVTPIIVDFGADLLTFSDRESGQSTGRESIL